MNKNILITTSSFGEVDNSILNELHSNNLSVYTNHFKKKLNAQELIQLIEQCNPIGIIAGTETYTRDIFEKAKNLKIISRVGVGLDGINLELAKEFGIQVFKSSDHVTQSVVELTIGLLFSLARHIHSSNQEMHHGNWSKQFGQILLGKTVGIVGYGKIGKALAKTLTALGIKVVVYDLLPIPTDPNIGAVDYHTLLRISDFVTFHCNANSSKPIWNFEHALLMKRGSYIINCARGSLIDEVGLIKALEDKIISGAALDVYNEEPYTGKLSSFKNVLLTPHIGSYSKESRLEMEKEAIKNIINCL